MKEGRIRKEDYRLTHSRKSRIDMVVATVYYTREDQRQRYVRHVRPDLERRTRVKMQGRGLRPGVA